MKMRTYAAIYDDPIRAASSSGGVFSLLAEGFDVVYGVAMTADCYGAEMIRVQGDIAPLRGSKYLQAKLKDAFRQAKADLAAGRRVLFSGTGCQINGLSLFLGKEYPNLCLVDVICHGAPSPLLWREYVRQMEQKHGKLKRVNFRQRGNAGLGRRAGVYIPKERNVFMQMFLRDLCLRPSCYDCRAKHFKKADLTIADFWGIERVAPKMNDGKGTSLVITRTDKGQAIFEQICDRLQYTEVDYEVAVRDNPSEYSSVARPRQRDGFFEDLSRLSFKEMEKKYVTVRRSSIPRHIAGNAKRIVKRFLRNGLYGIKRQRKNSDFGLLLRFERDRADRNKT